MGIKKCSGKAVEANAVVNSFIEMKKLSVSESKCKRIHISKKKIKVHHKNMANANQEKFLGDIVNSTVKIKHTIEDRKNRASAESTKIPKRKIVYEDIFDNMQKQKEATELFKDLIDIRMKLKEEYQANQLDPCTSAKVLGNSNDLLFCIDNYSPGI